MTGHEKKQKSLVICQKRSALNDSSRVLLSFEGKNFIRMCQGKQKKNFDLRNLEAVEGERKEGVKTKEERRRDKKEREGRKLAGNEAVRKSSNLVKDLKEKKKKKKRKRKKTEKEEILETQKKSKRKQKKRKSRKLPKGNLVLVKTGPTAKNLRIELDASTSSKNIKGVGGTKRMRTLENLFTAETFGNTDLEMSARLSIQNFGKRITLDISNGSSKEDGAAPKKNSIPRDFSKRSTKNTTKDEKQLPGCKSRSISRKVAHRREIGEVRENGLIQAPRHHQSGPIGGLGNRELKLNLTRLKSEHGGEFLTRTLSVPKTKTEIGVEQSGPRNLKVRKNSSSSQIQNNLAKNVRVNTHQMILERNKIPVIQIQSVQVKCPKIEVLDAKQNLGRLLKLEKSRSQTGALDVKREDLFKPKIIKKTGRRYCKL